MSTPITARYALDDAKRQLILGLIANGSSRRVAARYVACSPSTITRTAMRDPQFAAQLARAEQSAEVSLLRSVQAAAKDGKNWRAAAWLLERHNPEDFAARPPRLFTGQQVVEMLDQVVEILRGDVPEVNCWRASQKLDELIYEFRMADQPVDEKMTNVESQMTKEMTKPEIPNPKSETISDNQSDVP